MDHGLPTFEEVIFATQKRRDVFVNLRFGQAKCRIKSNGDWTGIDFDFWKMGADLSNESIAHFTQRHSDYLARNPLKGTKVKGRICTVFTGASVRIHVKNSDAAHWYGELVSHFADDHNFREINPYDFLEEMRDFTKRQTIAN